MLAQLHDLPNFLSGEEQVNTVHIQVEYKKLMSLKGSSRNVSTTSTSQQVSSSLTSPSHAVLPPPHSKMTSMPQSSTPLANSKVSDLPGSGLPRAMPASARGKSPARVRRALARRRKLRKKSIDEEGQERAASSQSSLRNPLLGVHQEEEEEEEEEGKRGISTFLFPGAGTGGISGLSLPDLSASPTSSTYVVILISELMKHSSIKY